MKSLRDVVRFRANIGKVYLADQPSAGSGDVIGQRAEHQPGQTEDRLREHGFREGYEAGRREGIEEGKSEIAPLVDHLKNIAEEIASRKDELVKDAEEVILKLSFAIARKIVGQELTQNPDTVLSVVEESLKRVEDGSRVVVRVNPSDLERVKEHRADIVSDADVVRDLTIEGDAQVGPGGCVVETNSGTVDARLSTQFTELEAALLEDFRHDQSEL